MQKRASIRETNEDMPLSNNVSLALHMMHLFIVGAQQMLLIRKLFQDRKECNNTGEMKTTYSIQYIFLGWWIHELLDMKGIK